MTSLSLSQRLVQLRGMIADCVESQTLLKQVDLLISFQKHMQLQRKDEAINQLSLKQKEQKQKIKHLVKQKSQLQKIVENLKCDYEIIKVQCQNLEGRLKQATRKQHRQKRVGMKQHETKTKEIQVQVDILSHQLMDDALRCYKKELIENEILRQEIKELRLREDETSKEISLHQTTITSIDMDSIDDSSASFLQITQEINPTFQQIEGSIPEPVSAEYSFLQSIWIKSKQIMTYFKDQ